MAVLMRMGTSSNDAVDNNPAEDNLAGGDRAASAPAGSHASEHSEAGAESPGPVHPALVPGVAVEEVPRRFRTDALVFGIAIALTVAFIAWGILGGDSLAATTNTVLSWVIEYTGFFLTSIATVV